VVEDEEPYADLETDPLTWTVAQLKAWLRVRRLALSGNKKDLQIRVIDFLRGPVELIPPIQPELFGSADDLMSMLKAMVLLITTVFQDRVEKSSRDIVDLRVRTFLTSFEIFDSPMRKDQTKRTWHRSYNFLCLLNLPEAVEKYGPVRRWFEGKWLGERYVSTVKDERAHLTYRNLNVVLMKKLHRSKVVSTLVDSENAENDQLLINTKAYSSYIDIERRYESNSPLPIVIFEAGILGCIFYDDVKSVAGAKVAVFHKKELQGIDPTQHGLKYWDFQLTKEVHPLIQFAIKDYAVLLPRLGCDTVGVYTFISKNWSTEMFGEYNFSEESNNYVDQGGSATVPDTVHHFPKMESSGWI
jgi:SAP domain